MVDATLFQPTNFQAEDLEWFSAKRKYMILYDRGLGKTVVATLRNIRAGVGTHVVVCPKSAMRVWKDHALSWWKHFHPGLDVDVFIVTGTPTQRKVMWDELLKPERTKQKRLFIVVYQTAQRDFKHILTKTHWMHVDQLDFDEAHKIRNRTSQNFKIFQPILRTFPYFSFLTGTPISRGAQEFWTLLNCCNPKYFSSYWKFVNTFCEVIDGRYGKEILGNRNVETFQHILQSYSRIRAKTDPGIAEQLPSKLRVPIYVDMDPIQESLYYKLNMDKVVYNPDGSIILSQTSMENMMRLRQLLVCPRIFDPSYSLGGAFEDFLELIADGDEVDRHCVLFTPFKKAFPFFRKELENHGYHINQLSGGISIAEQQEQIAEWRKHRGIMLNTILYAESYSLEPATSSYFIGYEWDPNANSQAEDRLLRLTTKANITNHYYRYSETVDDALCYTVNWKQQNVDRIMNHMSRVQQLSTSIGGNVDGDR